MALNDNSLKESDNDYTKGMTSDEANDWLNEHISLSPTYPLETDDRQDWKEDQKITCVFQSGTK